MLATIDYPLAQSSTRTRRSEDDRLAQLRQLERDLTQVLSSGSRAQPPGFIATLFGSPHWVVKPLNADDRARFTSMLIDVKTAIGEAV